MLRHFSRVQLCVTPETAAQQAPSSQGFSRQETGVGCHFLLQCRKVKNQSEFAQSCPTLSKPMDCSLPGSSIHGVFQARELERGAIAFSGVHGLEDNKVNMSTLLKCVHRYNSYQNSSKSFFVDTDKFILKFLWKGKGPRIVKTILKKTKKMGGITLTDIKAFYLAIVIKTV